MIPDFEQLGITKLHTGGGGGRDLRTITSFFPSKVKLSSAPHPSADFFLVTEVVYAGGFLFAK